MASRETSSKRKRAEPPQDATRNQVIRINVGGTLFHTTTTTLTSTTGHYLANLFAQGGEGELLGTLLRDESGAAFVDRDPKWFSLVLNFLRNGFVPLPPSLRERQELRQEALFYCLQPLADQIEASDPEMAGRWDEHVPCAETQVKQAAAAALQAQLEQQRHAGDRLLKQLARHTDAVCDELELVGGKVGEALARVCRRLDALRHAVLQDGEDGDSDGMM